jgi:fatty-acyl-CoA synthase
MKDVAHDGASQGEVVVRAPWLTQGYLGEPKRSEELWQGGWLHTGDVGTIDSHGYLKIVDRIKDVLKTGGEWVSSLDLEDIILRAPGVAEVAVVGMPDDKWGDGRLRSSWPRAEASLRRRKRSAATSRNTRNVARSRGTPSRPGHFVDAIPKTSVGKLDKKVIRANLAGGGAGSRCSNCALTKAGVLR